MTLNLHGNLSDDSLNIYKPATEYAPDSQLVSRSHSVARITSTIIINVARMRFWETDPEPIDSVKNLKALLTPF